MVMERHYQVVEKMTLGGGTAISGGGTPFRLNLTTERSLSKVKIILFGTINSSYTTHKCCQNVNINFLPRDAL